MVCFTPRYCWEHLLLRNHVQLLPHLVPTDVNYSTKLLYMRIYLIKITAPTSPKRTLLMNKARASEMTYCNGLDWH